MTTVSDWNRELIAEFRANGGKVGGLYADAPLLLLTTTGAKTGRKHTVPLGYMRYADSVVVFASYLGSPNNPDWYHNLRANPVAMVEIGKETYMVVARGAVGEEYKQLYTKAVEQFPMVADYQTRTSHQLPLIILTRKR